MLIKKEDIMLDGGIKNAIDKAEENKPHLTSIEVEVETLEELEEVLFDGRAKYILLDNMNIEDMRKAVLCCGTTHILEASGVGDKNLREVATTGVHYISLSSLIMGVRPTKMKMVIDSRSF